jgi:hypothetical protein
MDVRHVVLRLAGWAGVGDGIAFRNVLAALDPERAEMCERRSVLPDRDRDREAMRGHLAGEGDVTGRWGAHAARSHERDVHPSVLAARVLVGANRESSEDGAVGRPCPRPGRPWPGTGGPDRHQGQAHEPSRCPRSEHGSTVARVDLRGNAD